MARIVLCDDSKAILMLFERKLKDAGHEIVGKARDGEEGFKVYSETKPAIMLLDVTMPNIDGRDCLSNILKMDPSAKIIMVSAIKEEEVMKECLALGAKAFISKANTLDDEVFKKEVLSVIDALLKAA